MIQNQDINNNDDDVLKKQDKDQGSLNTLLTSITALKAK